MKLLKFYCHLLAGHPLRIIFISLTLILTLFLYTIHHHPLPSFKDPLVGFEARQTLISTRTNTYKLLLEDTVKFNISDPSFDPHANAKTIPPYVDPLTSPVLTDTRADQNTKRTQSTYIKYNTSHGPYSPPADDTVNSEGDSAEEETIESNSSAGQLIHYSIGQSIFCGKLFDDYAQVVIESTGSDGSNSINDNATENLFTLESLLSICNIDKKLRLEAKDQPVHLFQRDCERYKIDGTNSSMCCKSWSVPNYVTCLANKSSCLDIDESDLDMMNRLLKLCAPFFNNWPPDGCHLNISKTDCDSIPNECKRCDNWIFFMMNYLVDVDFITTPYTQSSNTQYNLIISNISVNQLRLTNIFLPIAKTPNLLHYYDAISHIDLKEEKTAKIAAMNLGLKNSIFDFLIAKDTKFFVLALMINLIIITIYSGSFMISIATMCIICLSLCLSYVIYNAIGMPIFPFMNLLAVIISSGICPDNAMLFCKPWRKLKTDDINSNLEHRYAKSIKDTFIASPATTIALSASYVSNVVAIKCFCVFAILSVLTNYLLIVTLLPPVLIIEKKHEAKIKRLLGDISVGKTNLFDIMSSTIINIKAKLHGDHIYLIVVKFRKTLIILFSLTYLISTVIVLYYPRFSPPDNDEFQLLSSDHPFERFDLDYKRHFWYEIFKTKDYSGQHEYFTLPIRMVFGVKAIDNGNVLDPNKRGTLTYDNEFDMSSNETQIWMLQFCSELRQKFVSPFIGSSLNGCFIETFKSWMEGRPCMDTATDSDRFPCCKDSPFPFDKNTFDKCLEEYLDLVHRNMFAPQNEAGPRYAKYNNRLAAVIVEYYSNQSFTNSYVKMNKFWTEVNDWARELLDKTAPASLKSAWFTSDYLELFALQEELMQGTINTIILEIFSAMIALYVGTGNISLCIIGSITMSAIMTTSVAILIIIGWTLNIVESICISLATGLSVDFALHYTISYKHSFQELTQTRDITIYQVIKHVGSPIALATITTLVAGFTILWSNILAYQQIGKFLIIISLTSWTTSTFLLLPLLCMMGPTFEQEKITLSCWLEMTKKKCFDVCDKCKSILNPTNTESSKC